MRGMGHKKLIRFGELKTFPNVLEYPVTMAGKWAHFFGNPHPLVLELACGKGEYTTGLARLHPEQNFMGVDLKGNRIWVGAKYALTHGLKNAAFLRTQIEGIDTYFSSGEVSEIWITFPDPQLRRSKAKKRLTHPRFLRLYQKILEPGGRIHLKTDSPDLYRFTKQVIEIYGLALQQDITDLYQESSPKPELTIKTYYEGLDIARSRQVFYLCFSLPEVLPQADEALEKLLKEDPVPQG